MAFLSGSATFLRYRLVGPRTSVFGPEHLDALRDRSALGTRLDSADGVECGWTAGRHVFDGTFEFEKNVNNEFLLFDLRTQTDKLPQDRLKAYYETDLKAVAAENPSGFATARQKRECKQAARDRLLKEAKDGRYRKWACVPCVWDGPNGVVYFGSTSASACDRFANLFARTFPDQVDPDAGPDAVTAASLAVSINPAAANEHLSPFLAGITPEDGPAWCPQEGVPQFLGNEFLLWLWYTADTETDTVRTPDGGEVTFMFQGGVKLEDPRGQTGTAVMNSEAGVRLPESRAAVRAGKLPRKAALSLVRHGEVYTGVLHAETLAMSSVRLPPWEGEGEQRVRDEERLKHVREVAGIVDQLFAAFLARRLSPAWAVEVTDIGRWLTLSAA
jgi:hypothetical protein